jgi:hypothetical protein
MSYRRGTVLRWFDRHPVIDVAVSAVLLSPFLAALAWGWWHAIGAAIDFFRNQPLW